MNREVLKTASKRLSYVLRHRPDSVGIELADGGWVAVETLLAALAQSGRACSRALIGQVVAENDKRRFEFSTDGSRIRARQGHSVAVDLGYASADPPAVLYHGTATRNLPAIFEQGLLKGRRHHVHLSTDRQTMLAVAMRHGKPALLAIDARRMHVDGHRFHRTGNDVWLTEHVPPEYLKRIDNA
jgi:putative RNA 2'-phosphotransferase